jgi:hypothetical protein
VSHVPCRTESHLDAFDRLWTQILRSFVIPEIPKMPIKDRKVAVVGLTRMLTQSEMMLQEPNVQDWCVLPALPPPLGR